MAQGCHPYIAVLHL